MDREDVNDQRGGLCRSHSENWYNSSEANLRNFDIHISGYNEDLRVMDDVRNKIQNSPNNPSGINKVRFVR